MKRLLILGFVQFFLMVLVGTQPVESGSNLQNLIIIIWDGTQRAHLLEMLDNGELPNLQRLIDETGNLGLPVIDSKKCQPGSGDGYMTQTGPANSAIATGLGYPGMANWVNWDPHPIPDELTLWEYFKKKGYVVGMVSSKDRPFWPHMPLTNAKPDIDFWKVKPESQEWVTLKALKFIRNHTNKKLFLWVHNQQPDSLGHEFGENSLEYSEAIKKNDQELGLLLEELSTLGIRDKTLVVVTPDHGFKEGGLHHRDCIADTKELFLVVSDNARILRCVKTQTDIAPCLKKLF